MTALSYIGCLQTVWSVKQLVNNDADTHLLVRHSHAVLDVGLPPEKACEMSKRCFNTAFRYPQ